MGNVQLKYKTFDSLLADVMVDFTNYSLEGMIEPQQLIKVAKTINKDLGLRIYRTKEILLNLDRNQVQLPDDFYVFNHALLCGEYSTATVMPQGTHMEEIPYPSPTYREQVNNIDLCADEMCPITPVPLPVCGCGNCPTCDNQAIVVPGYNPLIPYGDICVKPRVFMNCKGEAWELIQIINTQINTYKTFLPLKLISSEGYFLETCPNLYTLCNDQIWIKDGFLHSSMKYGNIYLSYEGMMEDDEGNLLILDHPLVNDYYEYGLKKRILENLFFNNEDVERKLSYVQTELRKAKIIAKSIVNTPDFEEMRNVFKTNRIAYNNRYVNMFKDYYYGRY